MISDQVSVEASQPPRHVRVAYYLWGARIPATYEDWLLRDIYSRSWLLRHALRVTLLAMFVPLVVVASNEGAAATGWRWFILTTIIVFVGTLGLTGTYYRDRAAEAQQALRAIPEADNKEAPFAAHRRS